MMTTNLFFITTVKQLRTDGSLRISLSFLPNILGRWRTKFGNSEQFSQLGWVWHHFGGSSEFPGGGGFEPPKTAPSPLGTPLIGYATGGLCVNLIKFNTQGGAKRTHVFELGSSREFGVTSNQKSTIENLVQSTIWKFPFAKKLQLCHEKC